MTDLVVRSLRAGEEHLFDAYEQPDVVGFAMFGRTYSEYFANNNYRPEWTWVAVRDERVVARAAWWAGPNDTEPLALNWLDFEDPADGLAVLRAAPFKVEYCLPLPPGWRDDPVILAAGQARIEVAKQAGMTPLAERLSFTWTPAVGLPERPGRLEFRAEPDDEVILDVLRRIQPGSLNAHKVAELKEKSPQEVAKAELARLYWYSSPREWWKLAYDKAGELVGITVPVMNQGTPFLGFNGVVYEQRGHGYAYDLLVECTHLLVQHGADRIVGETDATNYPILAHARRAGFPLTQERIYLKY